MKTTYVVPELNISMLSNEDIMEGSDTIIEVGDLYNQGQAAGASLESEEAALEESLAVQQIQR